MSGSEIGGASPSPKRRLMWRAGLGVAAAVGIALLVVGGAFAAPAPTAASSLKLGAPYTGFIQDQASVNPVGCGTTAAVTVFPDLNLTTGRGVESGKVTVHSCGSANSSSTMLLSMELITAPFNVSGGASNLTANWVVSFRDNVSATPGGASESAYAAVFVYTTCVLVDETNHTDFESPQGARWGDLSTTGGHASTYTKLPGNAWVDAKLNKHHQYVFLAEVTALVAVVVSTGSSHASAEVNMGTGGEGVRLLSITVK
jgi:hypothetical protein